MSVYIAIYRYISLYITIYRSLKGQIGHPVLNRKSFGLESLTHMVLTRVEVHPTLNMSKILLQVFLV